MVSMPADLNPLEPRMDGGDGIDLHSEMGRAAFHGNVAIDFAQTEIRRWIDWLEFGVAWSFLARWLSR
mgnify:CR=1 FL=1